jgi:hypothetical protein
MSQHRSEDGWTQNKVTGAIVASTVAAGVIAYCIRHARHEKRRRPTDLAGKVYERARDVVGDDPIEAGREFLAKQIIPEFKPALLAIIHELDEVVDDAFKRAEQEIKKL